MIPFPEKKYNIIYADPAWKYKDKSKSHGGGLNRITLVCLLKA